jgi:hypothetical protein
VGRQVKRPKQTGQPGYARVAREGIQVAIVCEGYLGTQVSKDNFLAIQKAMGRLMDELPEEGFTPGLADSYWAKGAAIMVCQDQETCNWLAGLVPNMRAGGLQAQNGGSGSSVHLQKSCSLYPGPRGEHGCFFDVSAG